MLLLLSPSETKRDGGVDGTVLDLAALSFPELLPHRRRAVAALAILSRNVRDSTAALGLGATQRLEIERNRALRRSPLMPAIERYTGVLYDALAVESLDAESRAFAAKHLVIHSALFGLLRADDPVPAYRLSHDSRLPGLSLRRHWRDAISAAIAAEPGPVLDLRSDSYVALGPAASATVVRVVSEDARGRRVALSHFNKHAKGEFARAVLSAGIPHPTVDSLLDWAAGAGIRLERSAAGELELVV